MCKKTLITARFCGASLKPPIGEDNLLYEELQRLFDYLGFTTEEIGNEVQRTEEAQSSVVQNFNAFQNLISAGNDHTAGLKKNGTVVAVGYNDYGQCDVSSWRDIIAISAGDGHIVGLKKDGTVVATGDNYFGQCDVSSWNLFN